MQKYSAISFLISPLETEILKFKNAIKPNELTRYLVITKKRSWQNEVIILRDYNNVVLYMSGAKEEVSCSKWQSMAAVSLLC